MPGIGDALMEIATSVGKDLAGFGTQHLKAAIGYPGKPPATPQTPSQASAMPQMPTMPAFSVPPMPEIPPMPAWATQEPQVALKALNDVDVSPAISRASEATDKTATVEDAGQVGESYAAEWEDLSIACAPCTRRHLSTITEATKVGAATSDPGERRENFALAAGEALVWMEYDVTGEKLAKANPRDRAAIAQAVHNMQPVVTSMPMAPRQVVLAWATVGEAARFARSPKPTDRDLAQVNIRMRDVDGMAGYLDSIFAADPRWQPHLAAIRQARHRWTREGYTPEALAQAETALHDATVAMTPDLSDAEAQDVARKARSARDSFYKDMAQGAYRPAVKADVDRDLPRELKGARLETATAQEPLNRLLGATDATDAAYRNILKMQELRGIPVREENLPPVIEKGEILGTIQGAYLPSGGNIWLSPAVVSESPNGLFTLVHESVHSLLHSPACDIYRDTPDYANDPHEIEANAAAALALMDTGLPFEDDEGHRIDSRQVKLDLQHLERRLSQKGMARVVWAAGILQRAISGDPQGAAQASGACPR